jgi:hypothetical protein
MGELEKVIDKTSKVNLYVPAEFYKKIKEQTQGKVGRYGGKTGINRP